MAEKEQITIARPSVASLLIQMRANANVLGTGTAFIIYREAVPYLITNWHNLSGRNPQSGQPRHSSGGLPDEIEIVHNAQGSLGTWVSRVEPLLDSGGRPLYREHPQHGRAVDVVALPLTQLDGIEVYSYDPWTTQRTLQAGVSDGVNIIGFPFGLAGGGALGVWVRGFVATEPSIDFYDLPCFLVDSRTRPGQSGSPVIAYSTGSGATLSDGSVAFGGGPYETLLGVYSGRINEQSDLGFVWKAQVARDIVDGGTRPVQQ